MNQKTNEIVKKYTSEVSTILEKLPVDNIAQVVALLEEARQKGRKVFIFGNGGSAATASHFASDLSKGAITPGKSRIKAIALTDNIAILSAWANDTGYENVFAEQLENLVEPGDIAIGISGSGNSRNVLKGIRTAKAKGAITIGLIGFAGGKLEGIVDSSIIVRSNVMEQIEDIHLLLEHVITTCLRG